MYNTDLILCYLLATAIRVPKMSGHVAFANIFCLQQPKMRFPTARHSEMNRIM